MLSINSRGKRVGKAYFDKGKVEYNTKKEEDIIFVCAGGFVSFSGITEDLPQNLWICLALYP